MLPPRSAPRREKVAWLLGFIGWILCVLSWILGGCVFAGRWTRDRCVTDRGAYRHEATIKATPPVPENPEPTTQPTTPPPENPT